MHAGIGEPPRMFASLEEVAAALLPEQAVHLALPVGVVLIERMRLPSTNRDELAAMMRLQLEKTLPFSIDEVTSDFEVISQSENESLILALAANNEQLDTLTAPLRTRHFLPEKITLFALHVATQIAKDETVCVIYIEDEKTVLAIYENGKLGYAQTIAAINADDFLAELPQLLLTAELDGVPTTFARVRLDKELDAWSEQARNFFGAPVESISLSAALPEPALNFVPASWHRERENLQRASRIRSRLMMAGVIYLALLLIAAGALFWMQNRLTKLDQQVRATQPQIDLIAAQKAKWTALAPAIEPGRYTIEILLQVCDSLPSDEIRLTKFTETPAQFTLEAEAPNAGVAVEFGERLKKSPGLKDFTLQINPPAILPNEHAQLRVFGKL